MNLLTDNWIPVVDRGHFRQISLKEVLCTEEDWQLASHRDDMELAALQLVISLVQVIFMPKDAAELRQRIKTPITETEYDVGISGFKEQFVLDHPKHAFMQTRGVKAKELTSMQKLFIGLPEGNNHAFFNETGEITEACPSCTAIALFNQASNCPSFGGGFKGTLRGAAPLTTLINGKTLKEIVWRNVLDKTSVERIFPDIWNRNDKPVWIDPVQAGDTVHAHKIGLLRGLFWQPAHVEVIWEGNGKCGGCGTASPRLASGFRKEKFSYELKGVWPHPHAPRSWKTEKGERKEVFASFRTTAPAWTQLNEFLIEHDAESEGRVPSAVISLFMYANPHEPLSLIVGGYRTNQAAVLQRRHDLVSLAAGWAGNMDKVERFIDLALEVKDIIRSKMYGFGKRIGVSGLAAKAEDLFYQNSEGLIHNRLRNMNWKESKTEYSVMYEELRRLSESIFEEITMPYRHDPKMISILAVTRRTLAGALNKLKPVI